MTINNYNIPTFESNINNTSLCYESKNEKGIKKINNLTYTFLSLEGKKRQLPLDILDEVKILMAFHKEDEVSNTVLKKINTYQTNATTKILDKYIHYRRYGFLPEKLNYVAALALLAMEIGDERLMNEASASLKDHINETNYSAFLDINYPKGIVKQAEYVDFKTFKLFGANKWKEYGFPIESDSSTLSTKIFDWLTSPCDFFPNKLKKDTGFLVLIPNKFIKDTLPKFIPNCPSNLRTLINKKYQTSMLALHPDLEYRYVCKHTWIWITKDFIPGSLGASETVHKELLESHLHNDKPIYQFPKLTHLITAIFAYYLQTGQQLLPHTGISNFSSTYCLDTINSHKIILGGTFPHNLKIGYSLETNAKGHGLLAMREFA